MQSEIIAEERATYQAFARAQMGRDGIRYQEESLQGVGKFTHDFSAAMDNCAQHYPGTMAGLTTAAEFFGVTKLENLDPMVAQDKSKGELAKEGIVGAIAATTAIMGLTKTMAAGLAEKLTAEVGPKAAQAGLTSIGPMLETLTKERGTVALEKLTEELKAIGNPVVKAEAVAVLKGLVEKSVPDEVGKKAIETLIDKAYEGSERGVEMDREERALDLKVRPSYGHTESGKIVGVYATDKESKFAVMHTTDDRYIKFTPDEWGKGGMPKLGSIVTIGNGQAVDIAGRANSEIHRVNPEFGKTLPGVNKVELFEANHPPKNMGGGTAIVVGDAILVHRGQGHYLMVERNDGPYQNVKSGDVIQFDARGAATVEPGQPGHPQLQAGAQAHGR